jgi:hypothetical protein
MDLCDTNMRESQIEITQIHSLYLYQTSKSVQNVINLTITSL